MLDSWPSGWRPWPTHGVGAEGTAANTRDFGGESDSELTLWSS